MPKWPWQRASAPAPAPELAPARPRAERKQMVLGLSDALGKFMVFGENSAGTPSAAMSLYEQTTAVSIPVNMVANPFSICTPVLIIEGRILHDHPLLDLLRKPSPHFSQELFFETIAVNYLVTGESSVVALGNVDRPPLELMPISPKSMTPVRGLNGGDAAKSWFIAGNTLVGTYEARVEGRNVRYLDGGLRELKVVRNFSSRDNSLLRGLSPLVSASKEARSHLLGTMHNVTILEKGGRVSLVFNFQEDMNEDDFEEVKDRVRANFAGAQNAGEIAVTAGGKLEIKDVGINPKDMDFGTLQQIAQAACAMTYHVPLPLITADRQTLDNYREGKVALYDDAVLPLSRRLFGGLGDFLLPRYGLDPAKSTLALNVDDVSALVSRRNDELLKRKQIGVETDNELRGAIGREPLEGGDVLYKPAAMVPVGSDLFVSDNSPDDLRDGAAAPDSPDDEAITEPRGAARARE